MQIEGVFHCATSYEETDLIDDHVTYGLFPLFKSVDKDDNVRDVSMFCRSIFSKSSDRA